MTPDRDQMDPLAQAEEAELARRRAREPEEVPGLTSTLADADERDIESALRPKRLDRVHRPGPGARAAVADPDAAPCAGAAPPDHVLLSGPPGLGKTTIAMIMAAELGAPLRITSGPAIERVR